MKPNAPEKIWINQSDLPKLSGHLDKNSIEYIRKDAFIENLDERMIAKYLYEKKGYPIDLNGHLPSFDETMKDVERYNTYKEDKFIEKACDTYCKVCGHFAHSVPIHICRHDCRYFSDFKNYMKGE